MNSKHYGIQEYLVLTSPAKMQSWFCKESQCRLFLNRFNNSLLRYEASLKRSLEKLPHRATTAGPY